MVIYYEEKKVENVQESKPHHLLLLVWWSFDPVGSFYGYDCTSSNNFETPQSYEIRIQLFLGHCSLIDTVSVVVWCVPGKQELANLNESIFLNDILPVVNFQTACSSNLFKPMILSFLLRRFLKFHDKVMGAFLMGAFLMGAFLMGAFLMSATRVSPWGQWGMV